MKILFVSHKYPPQKGGVAVSARRISQGLAAWCHTLHVLYCTRQAEPGMVSSFDDGAVKVFQAGESDRAAESGQLLEATIRTLHEAFDYDAVIGFYGVPTGFVAVFTAAMLGLPSLLCLRGNDLDRALYHAGQLSSLRWALEHATKVTAVTSELKVKARLLCARDDIAFIGNSVSPQEFFPSAVSAESGHLLFVGEMRLKKGSTPLLSCLPFLQGNWQLTLVGGFRGQAEAEFRRYLQANPEVRGRVHSLPYSYDLERLRELYCRSDLVLSPALWDGMPNSVLEAMACARPVLATNVGGVRDLIEDGKTGYLIKLSELQQLDQKIAQILSDSKRSRIGERARAAIFKGFLPQHEQAAYRELVQALI